VVTSTSLIVALTVAPARPAAEALIVAIPVEVGVKTVVAAPLTAFPTMLLNEPLTPLTENVTALVALNTRPPPAS